MKRNLSALAAACTLGLAALASSAIAAPPTDDDVNAAVQGFTQKMTEGRQAGTLTRESATKLADEALAAFNPAELTIDQLDTIAGAQLIGYATNSAAYLERLAKLAEADDVNGLRAALLRLPWAYAASADEGGVAAVVARALRHPALTEGFKTGHAGDIVGLRSVPVEALKDFEPDLLALESKLPDAVPAADALGLAGLYDIVARVQGDDKVESRQALRVKLLSLLQNARKSDEVAANESLAKSLARAESRLDGAFAKGSILNKPAPNLTFAWSNAETPIKTLADLKGKVVVLDFWATWCGPCIGSFPDVKKLQEHYNGYPVVILGVTSIQGRHITADRQTIDTKGDPAREMELMTGYIKDKDINWTIAFSNEDVFNPDYGVNGIPHVAIIDPAGVLRHRGIHPNSRVTPFETKTKMIDDLLKEFKLPAPEAVVPADPKGESAGS